MPNQYLNPLKSRLSPHSNGTESIEVPQKWILNFSTSIQVQLNESMVFFLCWFTVTSVYRINCVKSEIESIEK